MKIDFQKPLLDLKGEKMKRQDEKPFLLVDACQEALLATFPDEGQLAGTEKVQRFVLALKIADGLLPVEVSIEEAAEMKKLVAKAYGPLVVGRVWEIFDKPGGN